MSRELPPLCCPKAAEKEVEILERLNKADKQNKRPGRAT